MTDYFCTNFYLYSRHRQMEQSLQSRASETRMKDPKPRLSGIPKAQRIKAVRLALEKGRFDFVEVCDIPDTRSTARTTTAQRASITSGRNSIQAPSPHRNASTNWKRQGIICRLTGYNGGCIRFIGYTSWKRSVCSGRKNWNITKPVRNGNWRTALSVRLRHNETMRISAFAGILKNLKNSYGTGEHGRLDGICPANMRKPNGK